jgi:hypothetical protein
MIAEKTKTLGRKLRMVVLFLSVMFLKNTALSGRVSRFESEDNKELRHYAQASK